MLSPDAVPNHDRRKLKRIRPLPADIPTSHKREERTNAIKAASRYRCLPGTLTWARRNGRIAALI